MDTRFLINNTYSTRSSCNNECVYSFAIIKRSEKCVWILEAGEKEIIRRKIIMYEGIETIYPLGKYSMAPILRANKNINIPTEKKYQQVMNL
jgi:hypothetical protein